MNYENGDAEYFGLWNIEMVEKDTLPFGVGPYKFRRDDFEELFFEYAGNIDCLIDEYVLSTEDNSPS